MATSAPKFSLSLSKKTSSSTSKQTPKPPTRPSLGRPKFHDSDDEDDTTEGVVQSVSHFDQAAGGAIDVNRVQDEKKGPLVIRGPGNRDWKEESRRKRQKGPLPDGVQQNGGEIIIEEPEKLQYGLSVGQTPREQPELPTQVPIRESQESEPKKVQTADEAAMDALLGNNTKSTLVLPGVDTEEEAFQRDYNHAPDMATLDEYAAVPVEEFGAALLRGMGWKDGDPIGKRRGEQPKKPRVMERRPALLGIGAKEDAAAGVELGSWGKPMKGRKKVEQVYTPVLLRNRVTGEQLTEEELKVKIEEQKKIQAGESRNIEDSRDRKRHSSRRDRSPSRDDRDRRRHGYDKKHRDRDAR
ncbi:hypothetical protein P152DRAFT_390129 [Eremomyces bilateralis CBS 781.70]|uniref:Pre-mRNA-splicing factor n=1 Tax=Eremomyces bilateralis CBS 781.70 TaxID=1392243 RepID=A0A6G1GCZ6_9PEZI|nr:uncharacterized protein P152DRAFT_390129 [Eremomyces bilateralis CBS 781.70]KAF1815882.1 hypothetical protein P152DRAFT_390129 [Eremomyces bilateralis CBS 781.70]